MYTIYWHEEVHLESLWLIPYEETAYPKLPASCTPPAHSCTHQHSEQPGHPWAAELSPQSSSCRSQTPGTRECSTCMPSKPNMLLFGKSLSNFKIKEVREDHLQSVRISLLHSSGKSLTLHSYYVMLLRQTVLEKPESLGSPASLTLPSPPTDSVLPHRDNCSIMCLHSTQHIQDLASAKHPRRYNPRGNK